MWFFRLNDNSACKSPIIHTSVQKFPGKFRAKLIRCTLKFAKQLYTKSTAKKLGGDVRLERHQVISLLKDIITDDLAQPTAVYVRESKGKFELVMKEECRSPLQNFIAERGLKWRERKEMGVCIIYKQ